MAGRGRRLSQSYALSTMDGLAMTPMIDRRIQSGHPYDRSAAGEAAAGGSTTCEFAMGSVWPSPGSMRHPGLMSPQVTGGSPDARKPGGTLDRWPIRA